MAIPVNASCGETRSGPAYGPSLLLATVTGGATGSGGGGCDETGICGGAGVGVGRGVGVGVGRGAGWGVTTGALPPAFSGSPSDPLRAPGLGRLSAGVWSLARWLRSSRGAAISALSGFCWALKASPGASAAWGDSVEVSLPGSTPITTPATIASTPTTIAVIPAIRSITRPVEGVTSHLVNIRRASSQTPD
jgi:hypothetical protein